MDNILESKNDISILLGEDLETRQWFAIHLLVYSTKSKKDIANELGITEQTLYNWLGRVDFQQQVSMHTKLRIDSINEELATVYVEYIRSIYESQREILQNGTFDQKLDLLKLLMEKFNFAIMPQTKLEKAELPDPDEVSEFTHKLLKRSEELKREDENQKK